MIQAIMTYAIVIIAASWLVWKLFLPNRYKRKSRLSQSGASRCSSGCDACEGCSPRSMGDKRTR